MSYFINKDPTAVQDGGTGLEKTGDAGQVLTTISPGFLGWTTPLAPGTGTVTSVGATVPSFLSAGPPVTSSGSIAITLSGTALPVINGGTGLVAGGATNQVLTTTAPNVYGWRTPTTGTVTSVAAAVPSFLSITGSPITSSGTLTITLSGTALPVTSGGTGLTTVGTLNQVLTSNGTSPVWGSTISSLVAKDGVRVSFDPILIDNNVGLQVGRANYSGNISNQMAMYLIGADEGFFQVSCGEANGECVLYVGIYGDWIFGNGQTARYMNHTTKTRILRDGVSEGNFASNHPFQVQTPIGTPRAIQMGYQDSTDTAYIQSINSSNSLKPLLIKASTTTIQNPLILSSALPITSGGTGLNTPGPNNTRLTSDGTNLSWQTFTTGTVTSVAASVPSFLSITGTPITSSGTLAIGLSGTALPVSSGGTGLSTVGTNGFILTVVGGAPSWQPAPTVTSTFSAITVANGATFIFDTKVFTATAGIQMGREGNAQVLQSYGLDESRIRLKNFYEADILELYMGIYGDWIFGSSSTVRFLNHQCKTRILRDGVSGGNFAANHPFQIQTITGTARAIQMGYQDSTDTAYIQSMDTSNTLKPLLIRSSSLTLSSPLATGSGGTGLSTNGVAGQVLTTVSPGVLGWQAVPTATSNFTAITVGSGATFQGGSAFAFPVSTPGTYIGKDSTTASAESIKIIGAFPNLTLKNTSLVNAQLNPSLLQVFNDSGFPQPFTISASSLTYQTTIPTFTILDTSTAKSTSFIQNGTNLTIGNNSQTNTITITEDTSVTGSFSVTGPLTLTGDQTTTGRQKIIFNSNAGGSETDFHAFEIQDTSAENSSSMQIGTESLGSNYGYINCTGAGTTTPLFLNIRNDGLVQMNRFAVHSLTVNSFVGMTEANRNSTGAGNGALNFGSDSPGGGQWCTFYSGSSAIGSIYRNGLGTTVFASTSDYRMKTEIEPVSGSLDKILKLEPKSYFFNNSSTRGTGFIAHELQQVFPNAVTGEKDGEKMQQVDLSYLIPHLVKAIQELKALIQ